MLRLRGWLTRVVASSSAISHPTGKQVVASIVGAVFVEHDVTDEPAWERAIQTVLDAHGRLDVLVNNAGIAYLRAVTDTTLEDWRA